MLEKINTHKGLEGYYETVLKMICKKCKWYPWSNVLTDGHAICKKLSIADRSMITGKMLYSHCKCIIDCW